MTLERFSAVRGFPEGQNNVNGSTSLVVPGGRSRWKSSDGSLGRNPGESRLASIELQSALQQASAALTLIGNAASLRQYTEEVVRT